jgi:acetyltransferase-like isoleucine patch superfamily enzyme
MKNSPKRLVQCLVHALVLGMAALLPNRLRNRFLNACLGWQLDDTAMLSRLALVLADACVMGPHASIGKLTLVKGLSRLEMGEHAIVGRLNWISAFPIGNPGSFSHVPGRRPELCVGRHAAITNRHLIDCTDLVWIGEFATFAGFRSQIVTHSIDVQQNRQHCRPVHIGAYSFVGTGSVVLGGASVPDCAVVAAGSVVVSALEGTHSLYAGAPARFVKNLTDDYKYFTRQAGAVS